MTLLGEFGFSDGAARAALIRLVRRDLIARARWAPGPLPAHAALRGAAHRGRRAGDLVPEMFLVSAVGPSRAARLLLLGEELGAREAEEAGLVYSVAAESELLATARALANTLARSDPSALRRTKLCLQSAWAHLYETAYRTELDAMIETARLHWPK